MSTKTRDGRLEGELASMLVEHYAGIEVEVDFSKRWKRMCVTLRWAGFADLLPEERFERLVRVIPEEFRAEARRVCLARTAPGETVDAFLKLPRSEDVADREEKIYAGLKRAGFFEALEKALGPAPAKACQGEFGEVGVVLAAKEFSKARIRDAKLMLIRHGAYCDCQALSTVRRELARLYPDAD